MDLHPAHDRETVRVQTRRFQRRVVAVVFPGRRDEHATLYAGNVHFPQKLIASQRDRTMRRRSIASCVRLFRSLRRPDVDLRIDNSHGHRISPLIAG